MTVKKYLKQSYIYNVLAIEAIISEDFRNKLSKISKTVIYALVFVLFFFYLVKENPVFLPYSKIVDTIAPRIIGLILINFGIVLFSKLANFHLSTTYYFDKVHKNKYEKHELYTFSAGRILYAGRNTDILHGFLKSRLGRKIFIRLGINEKETKKLYKNIKISTESEIPKSEGDILRLKDVITYLYQKPEFAKFLNEKGITDKELAGATNWVIYEIESREYAEQWWRPEALNKNKPLAGDWAFGRTYLLDAYGRDVGSDNEVNSEAFVISERETEIGQIESALSKSVGANALVVGEPGQEKMQVVWSLTKHIKSGTTAKDLSGKKVMLLYVSALAAACKTKDVFEDQILRIFKEVVRAGNIILVIDNFGQLTNLATALGSDFLNLIDSFLSSPKVQVVALANTKDFHALMEPNTALMEKFEKISVQPLSSEEITKIISASAIISEKKYGIFFTFQAVQELSFSAAYYFPDGITSDKASDLLNEIAPWAKRRKTFVVDKDQVLEFIEQKTNIPTSGKISKKEKDVLLKSESLLAERVVGQKEALSAISKTLKRSRTGVRNPNRPIGSFLFLGPTGVGKTETAKALAAIFFGSEENMMRLDMSEYQGDDAADKLIGSFSSGKPGILSNMLREKQFGVMLLDEFEKTNKSVLDLFLQILDEGVFSDGSGKKVSARNIIFIATSNASADLIFSLLGQGKNLENSKEEIIADIVGRGIFKPELINRFDGAIIFSPLGDEDLKQIAKLMLKKVSKRMLEKGLILKTDDSLVNFIVQNGSNKQFGARPMNRFIQDSVENKIADLILTGKATTGKTLSFEIKEGKLETKVS